MATEDSDYVFLNRREIAASGIGADPKAIAAFEGLQQAAFSANPAAAAAAQESADTAQAAADTAATTASAAQGAADTAQGRADDAYALAETKVAMSAGPAWAAATGTAARTALASYAAPVISNPPTQAEVQALADAVQAISQAMVALITDLRTNEALTP